MKIYKVSKSDFEKITDFPCVTLAMSILYENYGLDLRLAGGLDYAVITKKTFTVYDRGCNNKDYSFQIRIQK
jgi:hypothetical protein